MFSLGFHAPWLTSFTLVFGGFVVFIFHLFFSDLRLGSPTLQTFLHKHLSRLPVGFTDCVRSRADIAFEACRQLGNRPLADPRQALALVCESAEERSGSKRKLPRGEWLSAERLGSESQSLPPAPSNTQEMDRTEIAPLPRGSL